MKLRNVPLTNRILTSTVVSMASVLTFSLVLSAANFAVSTSAHAEKRKEKKKQKDLARQEAKLQSFGTCRESEYYTKPLVRKYHFLELLTDGQGKVVVRDRQAEPQDLRDGQAPTSSDPSTYTEQSYQYSETGSHWAEELPMPLAMFGRECSAQYRSPDKNVFEVTRLMPPTNGPVKMPGSLDDGKVDYALTTVQGATHARTQFICRIDPMKSASSENPPLRCEKPEGERAAGRKQNQREGTKFLDHPLPIEGAGDAGATGAPPAEGAR